MLLYRIIDDFFVGCYILEGKFQYSYIPNNTAFINNTTPTTISNPHVYQFDVFIGHDKPAKSYNNLQSIPLLYDKFIIEQSSMNEKYRLKCLKMLYETFKYDMIIVVYRFIMGCPSQVKCVDTSDIHLKKLCSSEKLQQR